MDEQTAQLDHYLTSPLPDEEKLRLLDEAIKEIVPKYQSTAANRAALESTGEKKDQTGYV